MSEREINLGQIIKDYPLSDTAKAGILKHRREIENILHGKDHRLLAIVGPCSAWPYSAVLEYAERLKVLSEKLSRKYKVVMRVYVQKPRTTLGWHGPFFQPDPLAKPDIEAGIKYTRSLMAEVTELGLPVASEIVATHGAETFTDYLSWGAIGARSSEDQEHRVFASRIDFPMGIKNPTSGSIERGIQGVVAASNSHAWIFNKQAVKTRGNPSAHLILRGGETGPNYDLSNLEKAASLFAKQGISNPSLIVDASHDNSLFQGKKDFKRQRDVLVETIDNTKASGEIKKMVRGFMLESFLHEGKIDISRVSRTEEPEGISVTDQCLGWEETEELLLSI